MKVFEGYFCLSKYPEESFGRDFRLSDEAPVEFVWVHPFIDESDTIIVAPDTETNFVIDEDEIWMDMEPGKRYRITVEELDG